MRLKRRTRCMGTLLTLLAGTCMACGQAIVDTVAPLLEKPVQPTAVTAFQLQKYQMRHIPKPVPPATAAQWSAEAARIRKHVLNDIAFHGWPNDWVNSAPQFEQTGVIETSHGYRVRKFRYEVVPGLKSTALLYAPDSMTGRVPAILNLVGHEIQGNFVEYEQKRCINFAKRGIIALSLGWFGFGELDQPENSHDFGGHLDLVGSNALGLFYLIARRGLDYLWSLPEVDTTRIGVTGLSGGGWQTLMISAFDERVAVAAEVAGFGSLETNLTRPTDTQEVEEDATDLVQELDYPFFLALRAPRPTLLMHNAQDDCCFLGPLVKPYIFDQVRPFFKLYGAENSLQWYENFDPGTHNYQLDNRQHAYAFFTDQFHLLGTAKEIPSDSEIHTAEELAGDLPKDNLTVVGLARRLGEQLHPPAIPAPSKERDSWARAQRDRLRSTIRLSSAKLDNSWRLVSTWKPGLHSYAYRFDFSNGLSATGIWVASTYSSSDAPVTIVISDKGYKMTAANVAERVNRGEQVLAFEPLFFGSMSPDEGDQGYWEMLVASGGDRPLGLEANQLLGVARSFREISKQKVRVETEGIRSQVVALLAAAIEPDLFSEVQSTEAMDSLRFLLDSPVPYRSSADLFCLDLYKYFDIDSLNALASPVKVTLGRRAAAVSLTKNYYSRR
jgi:dienelactone hydrolase